MSFITAATQRFGKVLLRRRTAFFNRFVFGCLLLIILFDIFKRIFVYAGNFMVQQVFFRLFAALAVTLFRFWQEPPRHGPARLFLL